MSLAPVIHKTKQAKIYLQSSFCSKSRAERNKMQLYKFLKGFLMIPVFVMAAAQASDRTKSETTTLQGRVKFLEVNLAKAMLISETLWEFIKEKHNLTNEQLREKVYEVDMRDGTLDGKNQRKAVECPNCQHMVSSRHPACLYCGRIIDDSVFTMG